MRLAARHRGAWAALEDCGIAEVARVPGRFGSLETAILGRGTPLIVLPGIAGGWRLMAPLARALARHHRVILVGFRGDSRSGGPMVTDQRPSDHAFDVADLMTRLGLERPSILGVSYGGAVALELAVRYPHLVNSLVLSGTEATFRPSLGSTILQRTMERIPLPRTSPFLNQFFNVLHGCRPEPGPLVDFVVDRCWETDQAVVAARLRGLDGFDLSERLWEIDAPTLMISGSKDVVVPAARQKAVVNGMADASFEMIENAGHIGFLTHRSEFAGKIARFVQRRIPSVC